MAGATAVRVPIQQRVDLFAEPRQEPLEDGTPRAAGSGRIQSGPEGHGHQNAPSCDAPGSSCHGSDHGANTGVRLDSQCSLPESRSLRYRHSGTGSTVRSPQPRCKPALADHIASAERSCESSVAAWRCLESPNPLRHRREPVDEGPDLRPCAELRRFGVTGSAVRVDRAFAGRLSDRSRCPASGARSGN